MPSRREGRDAAAAATDDAAVVAAGAEIELILLGDEGRISSSKKRRLWSLTPSYSKSRLRRGAVPFIGAGSVPGRTKTPTITGISFVAIIVSKAVFSRGLKPSVFT
jgi:hypothetical protein